jgi:hypothetical protein
MFPFIVIITLYRIKFVRPSSSLLPRPFVYNNNKEFFVQGY